MEFDGAAACAVTLASHSPCRDKAAVPFTSRLVTQLHTYLLLQIKWLIYLMAHGPCKSFGEASVLTLQGFIECLTLEAIHFLGKEPVFTGQCYSSVERFHG